MQTEIILTDHAVRRFVERFRPGLDEHQGALELARLATLGELCDEPPLWLSGQHGHAHPHRYLVIGEALVLLCQPDRLEPGALCATTCLSPGTISERRRERRNRARSGRRAARRAKARGRGGRPWAPEEAPEPASAFPDQSM